MRRALALLACGLAACGHYSQPAEKPSSVVLPGGGASSVKNCDELFSRRVQPRLDFCRTCHVPGGVADVPEGQLYMLSSNRAEDFANLRASWERLGKNDNGKSRILKMASGTDTRSHTGGTPWPVGSDAYKEVDAQLLGFVDAAACLLSGLGDTTAELPLLGSKHGGHVWFDFCEGKSDDAVLPVDPRSLVQPGINAGKAVYFNAYWKDCHTNPEQVNEFPAPANCGELRASLARGTLLMKGNGAFGAAYTFAGNEPNGYAATSSDLYNNLWRLWGFSARPDNFDELVQERYGLGPMEERNPYPLPGEDPNATDGGSGQLPKGYTQTRNHDGSWSGNITPNCQSCHSTTIDGHTVYGGGGSTLDSSVISADFEKLGNPAALLIDRAGFGGRVRGTNNAQFSNVTAALGVSTPEEFFGVLTNGSTATGDTPAWWNVGHRPVKFVDAMFSGDAVRVDFALFFPLLDKRPIPSPQSEANAWISEHVQDGDHYIMSIKAPAYPLPVDTALAEQGAILFHSKNLWADDLHNPSPKPEGGNGSCASCHGAYAPRYVNDPAYLDSPLLEGIASYVVPIGLIGTDSVRMDTYNEGTNSALSTSYVGYPETAGQPQDCRVQNLDELRGSRPHGYAAPPLYGVWATPPYFHNGSVPNAWEVLKPADRHPIWRRVSAPLPEGQSSVVMGFDTSLARAYDTEKMGWKYEALACGTGSLPFIECDPLDENADPLGQIPVRLLYANILAGWNLTNPPVLSDADVEKRKIYNTHMFSQDNSGHEFTAVLTDAERRAIIEYLKTL